MTYLLIVFCRRKTFPACTHLMGVNQTKNINKKNLMREIDAHTW